jgi:glycosyltransferase involved in cell wall biosynthesis
MEYLSDSMAASDVHLVSLRPEMEGLVVPSKFYGIAASARPILFIGSVDGELARLVREYDCGIVVQAGRGDLLAKSVLELLVDGPRRSRLGSNARRLLDQRYSRANAHQRWHHLLHRVAASP